MSNAVPFEIKFDFTHFYENSPSELVVIEKNCEDTLTTSYCNESNTAGEMFMLLHEHFETMSDRDNDIDVSRTRFTYSYKGKGVFAPEFSVTLSADEMNWLINLRCQDDDSIFRIVIEKLFRADEALLEELCLAVLCSVNFVEQEKEDEKEDVQ